MFVSSTDGVTIGYADLSVNQQPAVFGGIASRDRMQWRELLAYLTKLCDAKCALDDMDRQVLCKLIIAIANDVLCSHSTRAIEGIYNILASRGKASYTKKVVKYATVACGWYEDYKVLENGKVNFTKKDKELFTIHKDKIGYVVNIAPREATHGIKRIRNLFWSSLQGKAQAISGIDCLLYQISEKEDKVQTALVARKKRAIADIELCKKYPNSPYAYALMEAAKQELLRIYNITPEFMSEKDFQILATSANFVGKPNGKV